MTDIDAKIDELTKRVDGIDLTSKAEMWLMLQQSAQRQYSPVFNLGGYFSPGAPVLPEQPELEPRVFQYRPGINYTYIPRMGYGLLDFATLRNLSMASKEIRLNIEKVKQIVAGLEVEFVTDGKTVEAGGKRYQIADDMLVKVRKFWEHPDGQHDFDTWLRMLLEEVLVTDALTLYPNKTSHGFRLEIIDGTTIRPLTSFHGRIPDPPDPAYVQVLYGKPMSWYSLDRLIYTPRNAKVNSPYGESPIEWIVQAIVQSIKHDMMRVTAFTEGNVPAAFVGLPSSWSVEQIKQFDAWYNALVAGDVARANRLMFLPHDGSGTPVQQFSQADMDNVSLDEWLMTVACWAYGNSPSEFGLTRGDGLGGGGYMAAGENAQYRGMVATITQFVKRIIDGVNRDYLDAPYAKFKWVGLEPPEDEERQATIHNMYIGKVYTADYVADQLGIPEQYRIKSTPAPVFGEPTATAEPTYRATVSPVPLPANLAPYLRRAVVADLQDWKDKSIRHAKKGWKQEVFTSDVLPDALRDGLFAQVNKAKGVEEIGQIFDNAIKTAKGGNIQKMITPFVDDPNQPVKDAAAREAEAALREYFTGLQSRIETWATGQK